MKTIFLDTNVFLHCRDLKDLPWEELSEGEDALSLLVPRATQREIDNFKGQGSTRRSKRAKIASEYFNKILNSPQMYCIYEGVFIGFPSQKELAKIPREPLLDVNKNDDSIVQDVLAYRDIYPDENATILTNDTGLKVTAKEYGIQFISIPDSWLLEPEPDENTKKIRELEEKIKTLESSRPLIELTFQTDNKKPISSLSIKYIEYPPLSEAQIEDILKRVVETNPMEEVGSEPPQKSNSLHVYQRLALGTYRPPSKEEIRKYTETLYPGWVEEVRKKLIEIPTYLNEMNALDVILSLENKGNVPAEAVLLRIDISKNLELHLPSNSNDASDENCWKLPIPPKAPRGSYLNFHGSLGKVRWDSVENIAPFLSPKNHTRDRNAFYWKNGRPSVITDYWEMECEEFRHKMGPENISLRIIVAKNKPGGGALKCTVSARNLPVPETLSIPIKITYELGNTYTAVLDRIQQVA